MSRNFNRDRFTWLAYLLLAFYGYFLNVLGPITPFLKDELHLSYTVSSLHFTAFAVGILLVGLGGHLAIARLGRWRGLWLGALGMSAGVILLALGRSAPVTIAAAFLMGLVGSLILAIIPSALSDRHGEQRAVALTEANVIASLVASAAPLMVGWFAMTAGGWRLGLVIVACTPLLVRLSLGRVEPMPVEVEPPAGFEPPAASLNGSRRSDAPLPACYWGSWAASVMAVSVEFCMIFWSLMLSVSPVLTSTCHMRGAGKCIFPFPISRGIHKKRESQSCLGCHMSPMKITLVCFDPTIFSSIDVCEL